MLEKTGIRVVEKIGGEGGGEKREKPRPPPLARFVNPQPGPDLTARIQDGDLITNFDFFHHTNSGFFEHPTACVRANLCLV